MQLTPAERRQLARFVGNGPRRIRQARWAVAAVFAFVLVTMAGCVIAAFMLAADLADDLGIPLWSALVEYSTPHGSLDTTETLLFRVIHAGIMISITFVFAILMGALCCRAFARNKIFYKLAMAAAEPPAERRTAPRGSAPAVKASDTELTSAEHTLLARIIENQPRHDRITSRFVLPALMLGAAAAVGGGTFLFVLAAGVAAELDTSFGRAFLQSGTLGGPLDETETSLYAKMRYGFLSMFVAMLFVGLACVAWLELSGNKLFRKLAKTVVATPERPPDRPA